MNIYESIKSNLKEYTTDQYGDRTYTYDEAVHYLDKFCKTVNEKFKDYEYEFDWRIESGSFKVFDKCEYFDYEDSNFDAIDKIVQDIFGKDAYLEPENSVVMVIAGAYLKETDKIITEDAKSNPYDYHVSEYPQADGSINYQINKARPYDDADYHWARSKDNLIYQIYFKGRPVGKTIHGAEDTIEKLKELNKDIEPRIIHD